jgi:hypothetical protein
VTHAYETARRQFAGIVRDADPTAVVPACPDWTVHELLAHQVHQLSGALDGSFPVTAAIDRLSAANASARRTAEERQEVWIRRGVAEWSRRSREELLARWSDLTDAAPIEALDALLPDLVVHLLDLQGAIAVEEGRDDALVGQALEFWASLAGVPVPNGAKDRFELLRVITGRRSRAQAPEVDRAVALYGWREHDLVE